MNSIEVIALIVSVASVVINLVLVLTSRKDRHCTVFDFDEACTSICKVVAVWGVVAFFLISMVGIILVKLHELPQ